MARPISDGLEDWQLIGGLEMDWGNDGGLVMDRHMNGRLA